MTAKKKKPTSSRKFTVRLSHTALFGKYFREYGDLKTSIKAKQKERKKKKKKIIP